MNILLTGGAGYIGSHAVVALSEAGHNVVILDNFCNSHRSVVERIEKIIGKVIPCVEGDVRDTKLVMDILQNYKVESVIHFAGLKAVGESVDIPIDYYSNNVQGTISLLIAMKLIGVKKIIFSSSATVYGNPQYLPLDEGHATSATNAYGRSKLHVEAMLEDLANSDSEWRIVCLRYFNPVGAHESGLIGEDPNGIPNNLMPYIAKVAAGELPYLNVYGDNYSTPDGTGVRDYIHILDLIEGHIAALNYMNKSDGYHIVNLGTGHGYSVLDVIKAYEKSSERIVNYRFIGPRAGDVASCFACVDKAKRDLGWVAKRSLLEMCSSSWYWQENKKNPGIKDGVSASVLHE